MKYVARFTQKPQQDAERNWSGYFAPFFVDTEKALDFFGFLPEGYDYMDDEEKSGINLDEIAEGNNLVRDPHTQAWRPFHHDGLSCWGLESNSVQSAMNEAARKLKEKSIEWAGFGDKTVGEVRWVACVQDDLHVFSCDDFTGEN